MSRTIARGAVTPPVRVSAPTRAAEDVDLVARMADTYLLGRLVPDLVHATSNELQVVLGAAELIGLDPSSPAARRRLAMLAEAAAEAVQRISDVRALALTVSGEAGRAAPDGTFAEAIIDRGARLARLIAPGTRLVVEVAPCLAESPPPAVAERHAVERLLSSLVLYVQAIAPTSGTGSGTTRLRVDIERRADTRRVVLVVACAASDNLSRTPSDPEHPDFALLSSLVTRAGGSITSDPGTDGGTRIRVTLPLRSPGGP